MQAHAQAGDDPARKPLIPVQFCKNGGACDMQQAGVGECFRGHHVRLFQEHDGFAEALSGFEYLDDFFRALRRLQRQFDLTANDDMKSRARIAAAEQHAAARRLDLQRTCGDAVEFIAIKFAEQREVREQRLNPG